MPAKHSNRNKQFLLFTIGAIVLLLLSFLNIRNYYLPKKDVLGISTSQIPSDNDFWNEYLKNNPNYVPGWLEIGRIDKALEIDPNYLVELNK